jgi:hypothetical protein
MREPSGEDLIPFLGKPLPDGFEARIVAIAPGCRRAFIDAEWRDAIVVIERGEIELEGLMGTRLQLHRGRVVWLTGLSIRALHNRGMVAAVLIVVARRHVDRESGTRGDRARIPCDN